MGLSISEHRGPPLTSPREKPVQRARDSHGQLRNFPTIKHKQSRTGQREGPLSTKETEGGRERADGYNNTTHRSTC